MRKSKKLYDLLNSDDSKNDDVRYFSNSRRTCKRCTNQSLSNRQLCTPCLRSVNMYLLQSGYFNKGTVFEQTIKTKVNEGISKLIKKLEAELYEKE